MAKRRAQKKPVGIREPGEGDVLPGPDADAKQQQLGDWLPEVSAPLRKAVDKYDDLYEEHSQLGTEVKSAELNALAIMEEEGTEYVRLRNGEFLCLKTTKKLVHKSYEKLMKDKKGEEA